MSRFAKQTILAGFSVLSLAFMTSAAFAQTESTCQELQTILEERKNLVAQLNKASANKKQLDAKLACNVFTKLDANSKTAVKWLDANQSWCQVPEDFVEGFKKDVTQVAGLRGQACKAAAQMDAARKQQQEGGGNPAWGGGLSGQYRMPKGAL